MLAFISNYYVTIFQVILGISLLIAAWIYLPVLWGAPWVPTSRRTIRKMLQMAEVKPGELIIDLGAGDGRVVIFAIRNFGARAVGVEIDPLRCLIANLAIAVFGLGDRAHVSHANMFTFDISEADVVFIYLLQGTNQKIKEKLQGELRPGTRVVSHTFSMSGWVPIALDDRRGIFLYEIGNTGSDVRTEFV